MAWGAQIVFMPAIPVERRQAEVARIRALLAQRAPVFYPDIHLLLAIYDEERAYQAWVGALEGPQEAREGPQEPPGSQRAAEDAVRRMQAISAIQHANECDHRSQEWRVPKCGLSFSEGRRCPGP